MPNDAQRQVFLRMCIIGSVFEPGDTTPGDTREYGNRWIQTEFKVEAVRWIGRFNDGMMLETIQVPKKNVDSDRNRYCTAEVIICVLLRAFKLSNPDPLVKWQKPDVIPCPCIDNRPELPILVERLSN
ncbi:hypothetical protein K438DRAFT_1783025 [Mycena galopus ATCC 62051]|nr:hypothetical protein K438DRAFT_1783025 [Mycena galopus ATCC 62051]